MKVYVVYYQYCYEMVIHGVFKCHGDAEEYCKCQPRSVADTLYVEEMDLQ